MSSLRDSDLWPIGTQDFRPGLYYLAPTGADAIRLVGVLRNADNHDPLLLPWVASLVDFPAQHRD